MNEGDLFEFVCLSGTRSSLFFFFFLSYFNFQVGKGADTPKLRFGNVGVKLRLR